MVKNTSGGSGHKKFARKHSNGVNNNKLRVSEDEMEIYAIVTKMLGNGMFYCCCTDGEIRLGHIRGKFTGRGKRNNIIDGGKWVLIGLREWDKSSKGKMKIQQCDLLEVYSDTDKLRLKESVSQNWSILDSNDVSKIVSGETATSHDDVVFTTEQDFERERLLKEVESATSEKITMRIGIQTVETGDIEDEINIDDI